MESYIILYQCLEGYNIVISKLHIFNKLKAIQNYQTFHLFYNKNMRNQTLEDEGDVGRYKGTSYNPGKIFKGTLNQAPIKIKVASIPSKQQNIIYRSFSQPAFGDSQKKFYQPKLTNKNTPGPGNYDFNGNDSKIYSKKGLGTFASSTNLRRLQKGRTHVPGPGTYTVAVKSKKQRNTQHKRSMYSLKKQQQTSTSFMSNSQVTNTAVLSSQIQTRDIFKDQIKKAKWMPGPGKYDYNPQGTFQSNVQMSNDQRTRMKKSASLMNYNFKSKLERFTHKDQNIPPVGYYRPQITQKPKKPIIYVEQQAGKKLIQKKIEKNIQKILNIKQDDKKISDNIGPGTYNPKNQTRSKFFTIKDTINDRFGNLKSIYAMAKKLNDQDHQQFHHNTNFHRTQYIASTNYSTHDNWNKTMKGPDSMFKSNTKRTQLILHNKVGPCKYSDNKSPTKKSHLINFTQKWVGV